MGIMMDMASMQRVNISAGSSLRFSSTFSGTLLCPAVRVPARVRRPPGPILIRAAMHGAASYNGIRLLHYALCSGTVPLGGRKSGTLELLAFDEYCRFDTSA
jgi:hypothetical protein